jgi:hypothetical protein
LTGQVRLSMYRVTFRLESETWSGSSGRIKEFLAPFLTNAEKDLRS